MNQRSKMVAGMLLAGALTFTVAACGDDSGNTNNPPAQAPTTSVTQSTEAMTDSTDGHDRDDRGHDRFDDGHD